MLPRCSGLAQVLRWMRPKDLQASSMFAASKRTACGNSIACQSLLPARAECDWPATRIRTMREAPSHQSGCLKEWPYLAVHPQSSACPLCGRAACDWPALHCAQVEQHQLACLLIAGHSDQPHTLTVWACTCMHDNKSWSACMRPSVWWLACTRTQLMA